MPTGVRRALPRGPSAAAGNASPIGLARTLQAIASDGPDAFYLGEPARAAAQACRTRRRARGRRLRRASRRFPRAGVDALPWHRKSSNAANTHGVAILHALDALEPQALAADDPGAVLQTVRAMGGDHAPCQPDRGRPGGNTVCTVVVDADGLAITLMSSIFKRFGSGIAVPDCGFVLQNRGSGFAGPGHINSAAPRKRPYHGVPGAGKRDGRFHAGFGVVGELMQPQGQL